MEPKIGLDRPAVEGKVSRPPLDRSKTGRAKGTTNKVTKDLRDMILGALADAGGQAYLLKQSGENPVAFMSLVAKLIPKEIRADVGHTGGVMMHNDLTIADLKVMFLEANAGI